MITSTEICALFETIEVRAFGHLEAQHVYEMAELAYKKGVADAANKCVQRAEALPPNQGAVARQCKRDVLSLL